MSFIMLRYIGVAKQPHSQSNLLMPYEASCALSFIALRKQKFPKYNVMVFPYSCFIRFQGKEEWFKVDPSFIDIFEYFYSLSCYNWE